jgi:hypothetical protein
MINDKNIFLSKDLIDLIDIDYLYEEDNKSKNEEKISVFFEFENSELTINKSKIKKIIKKSGDLSYKFSFEIDTDDSRCFFIFDEIKKLELNFDFKKIVFEKDKYLIKYCIIYNKENNYILKVITKGI